MGPLERAMTDFANFLILVIIVVLKLLPFVIIGVGVLLAILFVSAIICGLKGNGPPRGNLNMGDDIPNYGINNFDPGGFGYQYRGNHGKPVPPNPKRNH